MSVDVVWANAKDTYTEVLGPGEFSDAYGTENDSPCLLISHDYVFAIEGSIGDLRKLSLDISSAIEAYVRKEYDESHV